MAILKWINSSIKKKLDKIVNKYKNKAYTKFVKGTAGDLKKTKQTRDSAPQEEEVYEPEEHEEVVEEETIPSKDGKKKYDAFVGKVADDMKKEKQKREIKPVEENEEVVEEIN